MTDQAHKLRQHMLASQELKMPKRKTKIIGIASGKGGVGKSNISLNFALSLAAHNKKVLIVDLDIGMANIDVLMGVTPKETLVTMLKKKLLIEEVIEESNHGLAYIAGGSGIGRVFTMGKDEIEHFFHQFSTIQGKVDYIILDTGAGITYESMRFLQATDELFLIINPEPPSITDAYSVLKAMQLKNSDIPVKLIVNRVINDMEGEQTGVNFQKASAQFLNKKIDLLGLIPDDKCVRRSVIAQAPYLLHFPDSKASLAMKGLTREYLNLPASPYKLGVKGFLMKMLFHK